MRTQGRGSIPSIKKIKHKGLILHLYSVGWFSYWSHMAAVTLRLWERKKILPEPIFTGLGPYRWYTSREIIEYSQIITIHYQTGRDLKALGGSLHAANREMFRRYKDLSGTTRSQYDDSYIALPRAEIHAVAMTRAVKEAQEKAKDFFFKQVTKKRIGHENTKVAQDPAAFKNHPHQKIGVSGPSSRLAQSDAKAFEELQLHGAELRRRTALRRQRGIN